MTSYDPYGVPWVLVPILVIAFFFQLVTLKHSALQGKEVAKAGKRIVAAGLLVAILRYTVIPYYPVAVFGFLLISIGTTFACFERLLEMVEKMKIRTAYQKAFITNRVSEEQSGNSSV